MTCFSISLGVTKTPGMMRETVVAIGGEVVIILLADACGVKVCVIP